MNKRRRASRELAEEMGQHITELQQALDLWGRRVLENLLIDLRYVLRQLIQSPAFALAAVITLAVAIGANTAIFSVVEHTILAPPPFPDSARLLTLWEGEPRSYPWYTFSYPRFRYFKTAAGGESSNG